VALLNPPELCEKELSMTFCQKDGKRRPTGTFLSAILLSAAFGLVAAGCTHTKPADPDREPVQLLLPRLTAAMTGPAATLLTNVDGFHGGFTISFGEPGHENSTLSGMLYERGGKLYFEPAFNASKRLAKATGRFSLIWDAASQRGYVLSEALQGYAPLNAPVPGSAAPPDGKPPVPTPIQADQAKKLNGLATRIQSNDPAHPFTFTLSDVTPGLPPEQMFSPPDDFIRFETESALLSELASRQRAVMGPQRNEGALGDYNSNPSSQRPRGAAGGY
jgi:hypothetical protein